MDKEQIGCCGTYCADCEWKFKMGCKGCQAENSVVFWGVCQVAKCCFENEFTHCGQCPDMPCELLQAAFDHPEHGDHGERLANLRNWDSGNMTVIEIGSYL
jgi:hypothetical protein